MVTLVQLVYLAVPIRMYTPPLVPVLCINTLTSGS